MQELCTQFGKILNETPKVENGACSIVKKRNIHVSIMGRTSSVAQAEVMFESLDTEGNALNLAEIAVIQEELPAFIHMLVANNLIVSAIHNHWIFTNPVLLFVHIESVEPPLHFAQKIANAYRVLKQ